MSSNLRENKRERIADGGVPRVLDLFAGCGGFSLGFQAAGFELVAAVESDQYASQTHAKNFFSDDLNKEKSFHGMARDITELTPKDLCDQVGLGSVKESIDVIIGGPPCQAYTRVGRAKLRQVADDPRAFLSDDRGDLYLSFLEYVSAFEPLVVALENVPDMVNYGGVNVAEEICATLEELNYSCKYTLLNSAHYGVPQFRDRVILLAYAKELSASVRFPRPTHNAELSSGYLSVRGFVKKASEKDSPLFDGPGHFVEPPKLNEGLRPLVSAREAIEDLPEITHHLEGRYGRSYQKFDELAEYRSGVVPSDFARKMREWPDFENTIGVYDHVIRYTPRDFETFKMMKPGEEYPKAHEKAKKRFKNKLQKLRQEGEILEEGTKEYNQLRKDFVPPYDPSKFTSKWHKMRPEAPCRTITAHLSKDTYSHIHYDSGQGRMISVREAARLQSFPDGFEFSGSMGAAFRQIGNAVPPLLAKAVAENILLTFKTTKKKAVRKRVVIGDALPDSREIASGEVVSVNRSHSS